MNFKFLNIFKNTKNLLILANVLLVFFLIVLSNLKVLPVKNVGDFVFFTVLFLGLALYRPGWSFLFFVGTIALENINLAPAEIGIMVRPYQFFAALTILAIIIRLLVKRLNFKFPKFNWLDWALIIFAIAGFISAIFSSVGNAYTRSLQQSIVAASFVAIYFLVRVFIQNAEDLKKILPFFLNSGVIVVFYGIWQNIRFMEGLNHFEIMPGRPNATFTEPDWLGVYLVLLVAIIYSLIYCTKQVKNNSSSPISNSQPASPAGGFPISNEIPNPKSQFYKFYFLYFFLFISFILLIITVSRGAWLGAAAVTFIFLVSTLTNFSFGMVNWQWKKLINSITLIIATAVIAILYVFTFKLTNFQLFNRAQSIGGLQKITVSCKSDIQLPEKINYSEELIRHGCRHINLEEIKMEEVRGNFIKEIYRDDPNINTRREIYQKSWAEIKKHPVLGIGWGNIGDILGKDERGAGLNSSNIFLEVWLGSGIVGLLCFATVWFYILLRAIAQFIKSADVLQKSTMLFIILGWVGLTIVNLFNAGIFLGILWLYLAVSINLRKV